jgi:transposase
MQRMPMPNQAIDVREIEAHAIVQQKKRRACRLAARFQSGR